MSKQKLGVVVALRRLLKAEENATGFRQRANLLDTYCGTIRASLLGWLIKQPGQICRIDDVVLEVKYQTGVDDKPVPYLDIMQPSPVGCVDKSEMIEIECDSAEPNSLDVPD